MVIRTRYAGRMSNDERRPGEGSKVGAAAVALAEELQRFETMAASLARASLTSQKSLDLAAKATRDAAASQARFAEHLRALVEAVTEARDRQAKAAATINTAVAEIDARTERFGALRARFTKLGEKAGEVNQLVQRAAALKREPGASGEHSEQLGRAMDEALAGLDLVVEAAREITNDAHEAGATDLEREAGALRQQVLSAKNKLGLLRKHLEGEKPPSNI